MLVAKDKAIKRFIVRNIVDASAIRDIQDSSVIESECLLLTSAGRPTCAAATLPPTLRWAPNECKHVHEHARGRSAPQAHIPAVPAAHLHG